MSEVYTKVLTVKAAPAIDREKLLVRINRADKPDNISWYDFISIRVVTTNNSIVCKLYGDDIIEIVDKQQRCIRINEPLRGKLGVSEGQEFFFTISRAYRLLSWYYFLRYHPDDYVLVSTGMGIIAIVLGIIAILISCFN